MGITQKFTEVKREIFQLSKSLTDTQDMVAEMSSMTGDDRLQEINELADKTIQNIQSHKSEISTLQQNSIANIREEAGNIYNSTTSDLNIAKANAVKEVTSAEAVSLYKIDNKTNDSLEDLNEQVNIAKEYANQAEEYAEQAKGIAEASGLATKEDLNAICEIPLGGLIRSSVSVGDKFKCCDGTIMKKTGYTELYNKGCTITFYRLNNITRTTYDENGNITKPFFFNNLWTTDKDICKKKNPDLKQLYREIRHSVNQYNYKSPAQYVANNAYEYDKEYYYFDGYDRLRFCHIGEEITMSEGVITSASGFYDGTYEVLEEHLITRNYGFKPEELYYLENEHCDIYCLSRCDSACSGSIKLDGLNNTYSAAETDRKISDSLWLSNITDGKYLQFGTQDEAGTWTVNYVTNLTTDALGVKTMPFMIINFEFVTPPTFVADRDIFYGYRSLIFRITDANGQLSFYMAGYKSSSSLKWRHGEVLTGIYFKPNTKYRIRFVYSGYSSATVTSANPAECLIIVSEYDDYGYAIVDEQTYSYTSIYCPYNYYSGVGMSSIYHGDATAWVAGQMFDMYSFYIHYIEDLSIYDYGFELNENNEITLNGKVLTNADMLKHIADYCDNQYVDKNNVFWTGDGRNEIISYNGQIFLPKITNSYCDRYYVRVK